MTSGHIIQGRLGVPDDGTRPLCKKIVDVGDLNGQYRQQTLVVVTDTSRLEVVGDNIRHQHPSPTSVTNDVTTFS